MHYGYCFVATDCCLLLTRTLPGRCPGNKLQAGDVESLLKSVEFFIFDCDGESVRHALCKAPPPVRNRTARLHSCSQRGSRGVQRPRAVLTSVGSHLLPAPPRSAGVIWKGDTLIEGVSETLDMLRAKARETAASAPPPALTAGGRSGALSLSHGASALPRAPEARQTLRCAAAWLCALCGCGCAPQTRLTVLAGQAPGLCHKQLHKVQGWLHRQV